MRPKKILIITTVLLGIIVLINLPFLPGPKFLYAPAHLLYNTGQIFGTLGLVLVPVGLFRIIKQFRRNGEQIKTTTILLSAIPLVALLTTTCITKHVRDYSRGGAIHRAEKLIKDLDCFKNEKGFYPDSLNNTDIKIPSPGIIGIDNFRYQKKAESFELSFYQNMFLSFNYEIVTYSNSDSHVAKGEMKELYDSGFKHWKYEIYD